MHKLHNLFMTIQTKKCKHTFDSHTVIPGNFGPLRSQLPIVSPQNV